MEKRAINNLAMISEQSLFQKGWSHQLESNIQELNHIKAKSNHNILSFYCRRKQRDTRDVLEDKLTRITDQKDIIHYKYDKERKKNVINRREMTSKLITFKTPTKERNISKSHILTYKKHLPTLPAKISPSKEVSMLLQNNQLHDDRRQSGICNTVNLWENTSKKVKSRHYAEMFRKEQENPSEIKICKPHGFSNEAIKHIFKSKNTIECGVYRNEEIRSRSPHKSAHSLSFQTRGQTQPNALVQSQLKTEFEDIEAAIEELHPKIVKNEKYLSSKRRPFFIKNLIARSHCKTLHKVNSFSEI